MLILEFPRTLYKAYVIYTKNNSMKSRWECQENINISQFNKKKKQKIVNDNEIAQLARNRLSCKKSTKNCQASRSSSALFPSAPSPSLPTAILHVNSSYAHYCFFTKRRLGTRQWGVYIHPKGLGVINYQNKEMRTVKKLARNSSCVLVVIALNLGQRQCYMVRCPVRTYTAIFLQHVKSNEQQACNCAYTMNHKNHELWIWMNE
jgi:hypothetical protein